MSTIQSANLTDLELVREAEYQREKQKIDSALFNTLLDRFTQYANNERRTYMVRDVRQLELPI